MNNPTATEDDIQEAEEVYDFIAMDREEGDTRQVTVARLANRFAWIREEARRDEHGRIMGRAKQLISDPSTALSPVCNHTSVGAVVRSQGQILFIERARPPYGWACPAGHIEEGEGWAEAALRELREEVGLDAVELHLRLQQVRMENPCRRKEGDWHSWSVFEVRAGGDIALDAREVKQAQFFSQKQMFDLARRTHDFREGHISEAEWEAKPGLEPVWRDLLVRFGVL